MSKNRDNFPLVSIGVPVYNGQEYIGRALKSLSLQDYPNIEIIISNNFSSDNTINIIKKYSNNMNKIRIYTQRKNIGIQKNFKFVLEKSLGKYFFWAADDDQWTHNYVSKCVDIMEKNKNISVVQSDTLLFREGELPSENSYLLRFDHSLSKKSVFKLISIIFRKKYNYFFIGIFVKDDLVRAYKNLPKSISSAERFLLLQLVSSGKKIETTYDCNYVRQLSKKDLFEKYENEQSINDTKKELMNIFDFNMVKVADGFVKNNTFAKNIHWSVRLHTIIVVAKFKLFRSIRTLIRHFVKKFFGNSSYVILQKIFGRIKL